MTSANEVSPTMDRQETLAQPGISGRLALLGIDLYTRGLVEHEPLSLSHDINAPERDDWMTVRSVEGVQSIELGQRDASDRTRYAVTRIKIDRTGRVPFISGDIERTDLIHEGKYNKLSLRGLAKALHKVRQSQAGQRLKNIGF